MLGVLAKQHWITPQEAEWHFISTVLGEMETEHFKFFFPGAPSEWDEDYLNSVLAHQLSIRLLRAQQKWEADKVGGKISVELPESVKQKNMDRARAFHQVMSKGQ